MGILAFLAIISNGRGAKLDAWLASPASNLAPAERHTLEEWVKTKLIQRGIVSEMHVNPGARDRGLRLIVYKDEIPGLFASEASNAAYDPTLDSIFIDRGLVFDDDGTLRDEALLEFVILHELGHRARRHHGISHFSSRTSSIFPVLRTPSTQQETEADSYAMDWMIRVRKSAGSASAVSTDEVVRELDSVIEGSLLGSLLSGNSLGLEQSDIAHPALLSRARTLLDSLSLQAGLSQAVLQEQRAYLSWIETALSDARGELSAELLAPNGTKFERGTETPFGAAFVLSDGRLLLVRKEDVISSRSAEGPAMHFEPVGKPVPGIWPPQLNSGSSFWWGNGGLYLLMPIGRLFFADRSSDWSWKQVSKLSLPPDIGAVSLSHRPSSTECPTLIFSGGDAVEAYRLVRSGNQHKIELIARLNEPALESKGHYTFDFGGSTRRQLYFWTNAGSHRLPSSQNIWELPVVCSGSAKGSPRRLDITEIKTFRLYGLVPLPSENGFLAVEVDVPNGQLVFHFLERGKGATTFSLKANARPPGYQSLPSEWIYDFAGVDQVYFLSGNRFVAVNVHGWGFYVLDLKSRKFVLGGAFNRMNLVHTPIGGTTALATTVSGTSRIVIWSFDRRN